MQRRGFLGTMIGGGFCLPHNIGKIIEPTKSELRQALAEKPEGLAVVSGQAIKADSVTLRYDSGEQLEISGEEARKKLNPKQFMEVSFIDSFGRPSLLTIEIPRAIGISVPRRSFF